MTVGPVPVELGLSPAVRRLGTWDGRTALVTGAAGGIGAAIGRALVARGVDVTFADIDARAAARAVAGATGRGSATAAALDVTDAEAFARVVREVRGRTGRFDLLFNNAGIAVGGEAQDVPLADWTRLVDVNIRGVVHGVLAAYPLMVEQGHGHLVNTASLAGLIPTGLFTGYGMTKHAVVGLSLSLRAEAAVHGVKVTAVCPGGVETPLLGSGGTGGFDIGRYVSNGPGMRRPLPPRVLAEQVLAAVEADRALLVTPRGAHAAWLLGRLAPRVLDSILAKVVAGERQAMRAGR